MLFSIDFNALFYTPAKNNKNPQVSRLFAGKLADSSTSTPHSRH